MMEHNCTGRCALIIKRLRRLRIGLCGLRRGLATLLFAVPLTVAASPVDYPEERLAAALAIAEGAWVDTLLKHNGVQGERDTLAYDEQIFTELSPILDSPEAIKLPEDQLLTD